jgi:hexosaminidase
MKTEFSIKGFHIDLRIQVMPMPALRKYVAELAEFGLNTLLIEWEAAYPYDKHAIISSEYAYTREEVESFIAYCGHVGIDVIPLQQCFGHAEYILRHERYASLRESNTDICQVCPLKSVEAFTVFRELLADIASTHPSKYLHIGGDETYLLGHCPQCRAKAQHEGKSRLYVDYFKEIARCVIKLGRRPVLWADMLLKYPEAVEEMPKECVFVDWNYGWEPDHFGNVSHIESNGFEIWGAAALRAHPDNHSLTSWQKRFHNLRDFIPRARNQGYTGMFLNSWSTSGVYGYEWDQSGEVVELHPLRRVYPLSGFRILLAAYVQALKQSKPIEPHEFVKQYAAERFGLSPHDGDKLWQALTLDATLIQPGMDIGPVYSKAQKSKRLLAALHPNRHENEFEHLRLMADLREYHARFKRLESEIQSPQFSSAQIPQKTRALEKLLEESMALDRRFMELNAGFLYEKGIAEEVEAHTKKLRKLHDRLSRAGRKPRGTAKTPAHHKRKLRWPGSVNGVSEESPLEPSPTVAAE